MCARCRRPGAPMVVPVLHATSNGRPARSSAVAIDATASTRAFERRAVVRRGADVEHHQHRRAPPRLVLAHHQMAAARGGPPVHVAQVVAGRVLAQRHEVAARLDPRPDRGVVAVEVETADVGRRRRSRARAGRRSPVRCRARRRLADDEPERIGERRAQRPDLEAAAPVGREAVGRPRLFARRERREQEPRRAPALVERVGDRERRLSARRRSRRGRPGPRRRPAGAPSGSGGRRARAS